METRSQSPGASSTGSKQLSATVLPTPPPSIGRLGGKKAKEVNRVSLASFDTTVSSLPVYEPAVSPGEEVDGRWRRRGESTGPPGYPVNEDPEEEEELDSVLDRLLDLSSDLLVTSRAALQSSRTNRSSLSTISNTVEAALDRTIRSSERELRKRLDVVEERTVMIKALERELVGWGAPLTSSSGATTMGKGEEARRVGEVIVAAERAAGSRLLAQPPHHQRVSSSPVISDPSTPSIRPSSAHMRHFRSSSQAVPRSATLPITADSTPSSPPTVTTSSPLLTRLFKDPSPSHSPIPSPSPDLPIRPSPSRASDALQTLISRRSDVRDRTVSARSSQTVRPSPSPSPSPSASPSPSRFSNSDEGAVTTTTTGSQRSRSESTGTSIGEADTSRRPSAAGAGGGTGGGKRMVAEGKAAEPELRNEMAVGTGGAGKAGGSSGASELLKSLGLFRSSS